MTTHFATRLVGLAMAAPLLAGGVHDVLPLFLIGAVASVCLIAFLHLRTEGRMFDRRVSERRAFVRETGSRRVATNLRASVAVTALTGVFCASIIGCTAEQKQTTLQIMQAVSRYAPTAEAALDSTALALAALDPAVSAAVMVGVTAFDTLSKAFNDALAAYLANPTATALQDLQAAINAIEANVNTASANALGIKDKVSQALALGILKAVLTVATYIFGLVSGTESAAMLDQLKAANPVQLTSLRRYMDEGRLREVAHEQGVPSLLTGVAVDAAFDQAEAEGF